MPEDEELLEENEELDPSAEEEYYEDEDEDEGQPAGTLGEALQQQMRALPWYLGSTVIHLVILLLLMLIPTAPPPKPRKKVVIKTTVKEQEEPEEEEEEIEEPNEDPLEQVMKESNSAITSEVASEIQVDTKVEVNTDVSIEETEEVVGDPSEEEVADADDDAAPSLMGIRGRFSAKNGVSAGFRGGFGKIGRGLHGMIGGGGGGGGSSRGLCLVWLLDMSGSMKDDQESVARQARDIQELLTDGGRKRMVSSVVTYGQNWMITQPPTPKASQITEAILNVDIDDTGVENTSQALVYVCDELLSKYKGWTKVIVLLTDENATDDDKFYSPPSAESGGKALNVSGSERRMPLLEVALRTLRQHKTRLFVIGKEAPFQMDSVWEPYVDSEGRKWVLSADRGPETPRVEVPMKNAQNSDAQNRARLQGDYVKSGYGMYCHAYLAKYSRGAYFILDESDTASQRPMSPSERARFPFRIDWKIMDKYKPLMVSRLKYKDAILSTGKQGRKVWQLNEYFRENGKKVRRYYHCFPPHYPRALQCLRARRDLLIKLVDVIGDARASDEELASATQCRQMANIDLYYCVLLADQMITDAFLDAYEKYSGSTAPPPEGMAARLNLRKIPGAELTPEQKQLFDERMIALTEACNQVIRRHSNTPWAVAARWVQKGPADWGAPHRLERHEWKPTPHPRRPKM
jgi:hypothetical protein